MNREFRPSYLDLDRQNLNRRIEKARSMLSPCTLCPRGCRVNRTEGRVGACKTASKAKVSSFNPHFGEERPLVGSGGSGTIFFSNCNLGCVFCQNYEISQLGAGELVEPREIASMMLHLSRSGCENINLVSPTHVVPQILEALPIAIDRGLQLPIVYNTGGYDSVETLRLLDGIIDIYMPDMKYSDNEAAGRFSGVGDYVEVNRKAVAEMHRQVGDLQIHEGVATRGLLVRHLILPEDLAGTEEVVRFLSNEISNETYLNLMNQYRPCYRARDFPSLSRRITRHEYVDAVKKAKRHGLRRLDSEQGLSLHFF
jgi:putative pyruvate formate lyase activating enzyme